MGTSNLMERLRTADRAWKRTGACEAFLRAIKFLCGIAVLIVAIDLLLQLGPIPRLVLSVTALVALAVFLFLLARRIFHRTASLMAIARHLESRDGTLGSKLVNLIQLREQADDPARPKLTRDLARRAVKEAETAVTPRDFTPLTKSPTMKRSLGLASIPILVLLIPVVIFAPIAGRELLRFVDPFGDHPPFSFTSLKIVTPETDGAGIVYRRPVSIEVEYSGHRPKELFLTVESEGRKPQTIPMFALGDRRFVQQIDHVESDLVVRGHNKTGRSLSEARTIPVILTPQLEGARVAVQPPEYTRIAQRETKLGLEKSTAPTVSVLAGSDLAFSLDSNRPLSNGSVGLESTNPEATEFTMAVADPEHPHTVQAKLTATESGRLHFDLRDVSGLPADREIVANLVVTHDLPPTIEIAEPAADGFIVDTFSTNVGIRSADDYGLKSLRIHSAVNDTFGEPKIVEPQSAPPQRDALETIRIAPSEQGAVPGDVIHVFAEATDIRPDPQMARSRTLKLEVISEEQYNDFLRKRTEIRDLEAKYAALHNDLRDLAQRQRELAEKARAAEKSGDTETRDRLAAEQSELNAQLLKLADRMESATRDNPLYDLEKELQKVLDKEAAAIRESVAQNQEELGEFLAGAPSGESNVAFGENAQAQADRLEPARKAAEKRIAEAIEDADLMQQLLKAISAYQRLYETQKELASQTAAYKSKIELTDDDRLALQQMAGTERMVGNGLEKIVNLLREGAQRARENYPEAAADAEGIANAIEGANLQMLADVTARTMVIARGGESHDRAEHLRQEMEKLMGQCSQCQGGMGGELAMRLKLMHQMMAGQTFEQMSQCQSLSLGQGQGMGGMGVGMAGSFGVGQSQMGPQSSLLGGESLLGQNAREESVNTSQGRADGAQSPEVALSGGTDADRNGPQRLDRPSESAAGEAMIETYSDVVEAYFKKLTAPKTP